MRLIESQPSNQVVGGSNPSGRAKSMTYPQISVEMLSNMNIGVLDRSSNILYRRTASGGKSRIVEANIAGTSFSTECSCMRPRATVDEFAPHTPSGEILRKCPESVQAEDGGIALSRLLAPRRSPIRRTGTHARIEPRSDERLQRVGMHTAQRQLTDKRIQHPQRSRVSL